MRELRPVPRRKQNQFLDSSPSPNRQDSRQGSAGQLIRDVTVSTGSKGWKTGPKRLGTPAPCWGQMTSGHAHGIPRASSEAPVLSASDGRTDCLIDYPRPVIALALALAQLAIVGCTLQVLHTAVLARSTTGCDPSEGAALLLGSHVRMLDDNGRCYLAYLGRVFGPMLSDVAVGETGSKRSSARMNPTACG